MDTLAQEKQPQRTVSIRAHIDKSLDREVERAAFELDIPKRQIVEDALRLWLRTNGRAA